MSFPKRINFIKLAFATALVMMCVSAIGAPVSLATWPLMEQIQNRVNPLVMPAATLINCLTVGLVLLALSLAAAFAKARPGSVWARNDELFNSARVVAFVYLAEVVVAFAGSEISLLFQGPFSNVTQLDMLSVAGRMFIAVVLPAVGVALLIVVAPHLGRDDPRRAV